MKKILILLLVVSLVAGGWFFFKHRAGPTAEATPEKPAAKVGTAVLKAQEIAQALEAFGVVIAAPSADRMITAPYDCIVRKLNVSPGSAIGAGDVIMELDPSADAKLAFDSARSVLALATKALAATQERYDLKLATSQDLLAAQQTADDAKLKFASLEARGLGGDGNITALAGGVVSRLEIAAGAQVLTGAPLITVAAVSQLEVRLGVEAGELADVAAGQSVELASANRAEAEKVLSNVRAVGGALDPITGAAEVFVPVPGGAPLLLGEHVRASIVQEKKENALVVPRSAVLPDDDKQIMFTVKDGKAVKHEVKIGITADALVEVTGEGLKEGDVVVTLGNYELEDGMAIQPAEKEEKKDAAKDEKKPDAKDASKAEKAPEAKK
jgi:RND family efflux transporter MFP subunit